MKRFNVFFTFQNMEKTKEAIASFIAKHITENDCTTCKNKDACPIKHNTSNTDAVLFADADTLVEINNMIDYFYQTDFIESIILFDYKKYIAYIYKGKGILDDIKKNVLPPIVAILLIDDTVFFDIEDLRLTMIINYQSSILN